MKCTCKLKEKLKVAREQKNKYDKKCLRISKLIANREGKKLRLVVQYYATHHTMYVVYQAEVIPVFSMDGNKTNIGFFDQGKLGFVPWSTGAVDKPWRDNGKKVSSDIVTYYGKQYRINNKFQVCEVISTGMFKKVLHEVVISNLKGLLGVEG